MNFLTHEPVGYLVLLVYQIISYLFHILAFVCTQLLSTMGRAKEKILARNKIKSDKKAAKIEDRERQRLEEARQAAELRQVRESQTVTDRDKQKKRKAKYLLREVEVQPAKPSRITKESSVVPPNPNHDFVQKPIWKDHQAAREAALLEREHSNTQHSRMSMEQEDDSSLQTSHSNLEYFLRPEELKIVTDFFLGETWKRSTLYGINLSEVTPAVAAVALNRFDLIKRLIKDEVYLSDYSNKWVTPLGCAVITQNWDMIEFILEKDVEAHALDKFGNTPLIQAALTARWNCYDMANLWHLLKSDTRTDVSGANKVGLTLMHALAWRGWYEVLEEVLRIQLEETAENSNSTWLLVNATMCDGTTPLHFALSQGHGTVALLLIANGSVVHEEDKNGCTPLCRAIGQMYNGDTNAAQDLVPTISPACEAIIQALNQPECPTDVRNYALRRLQLILNPLLDEQGFVDAFYSVGRSVFSFLVRFIQDGVDLLLDIHFFNKLISSGKKHMNNSDFLVTMLGILFDVLVYAENLKGVYSRVSLSFIHEGGADFCLRVMQTINLTQELLHNSIANSTAPSLSSAPTAGAGDYVTGCFGIAATDASSDIETNIAIAALMPLIQLIDSGEMTPWFNTNFRAVKSAYETCRGRCYARKVLPCDLDDNLVERTRRKVRVFELMLKRETWSRPQDVIQAYLQEQELNVLQNSEPQTEEVKRSEDPPIEKLRPKLSKSARKKKARKERADERDGFLVSQITT